MKSYLYLSLVLITGCHSGKQMEAAPKYVPPVIEVWAHFKTMSDSCLNDQFIHNGDEARDRWCDGIAASYASIYMLEHDDYQEHHPHPCAKENVTQVNLDPDGFVPERVFFFGGCK